MNNSKEIQKLLKQRGAEKVADAFADSISKGRVSSIKKLNDKEAEKLIESLKTFTVENLLQLLYTTAFDLKAIKTKEASAINDAAIIEYCIKVLNADQSKYLYNKRALSQLSYIQLFVLTTDLGAIYLQHLATNN